MNATSLIPGEHVYTRTGSFAVFNQFGVKLDFSDATSDAVYYAWLDAMTADIGRLVPGAEIAEKSYARTEPRKNIGVYYDTADYRLLRSRLILRTTCNKKTHAFCAFKQGEDERHVRRDHRYVFEGEEKSTIQAAPTSPAAVAIVTRLLVRDDIEHPGTHLNRLTGIHGGELSPSMCLEQYRHPFFVWLDKRDALRCSMDRVQVFDLRVPEDQQERRGYSEVELPIYPHIDEDMARDPRVGALIRVLCESLSQTFGVATIDTSKYERGAALLGLGSGGRHVAG
jgi:hypothetical protein